jgi:RES domain
MSEVRPPLGAMVSVARFEAARPLRVVDCSVLHGRYVDILMNLPVDQPWDPKTEDELVWANIDDAFSEPVGRNDDVAEYAPTQTLSELFRTEGYDGVVYRSAFRKDGFNVAIFDPDSARQVASAVYKVKDVQFMFAAQGEFLVP